MEESLSNRYWKRRCELAERFVNAFHYTEMPDSAVKAYSEWYDFTNSPTDMAIYTGFIKLLKLNDMWYEFCEPSPLNGCYELLFGKNGSNFRQAGWICGNVSPIKCFEAGLECLKKLPAPQTTI